MILLQVIIILFWKQAKYWTIANLFLLLIVVFWYGAYSFMNMAREESAGIFHFEENQSTAIVTEERISQFPLIVQQWLRNSQVIGTSQTYAVRLQQKGEMRTKPDADFMPFEAAQYFNCVNASFVWTTKVRMFPKVYLFGRDKLVNAKGAMLIKLGALISVVDERESYEITSGAMLRYLAEICWFPSAALYDHIQWKSISDTSAEATLTINNISVSGVFNFSEKGEILSFTADRFYGDAKPPTLEKWCIEMLSYKEVNNIIIPDKAKVIWKLPEDDFHWLTLEIVEIEYNVPVLYE
ncbi:DUF6544 family protein [Kordia sp. SMS9]|uniref:DUF6544 family protein n=1 Tax=Kordia sp. SMS9 TaxID=2282170 RepID=UPI001965BFD2|nr:DUF6544 family protein [Kordia sp. SMS9]